MLLGEIASKTRNLTNTDTTSYSDANLLIDINIWLQKAVTMILESVDESDFDDARNTDYPILTTSMVAGQRDYAIPVSEKVLKIKRVDLSYDGVNYYRAEPLDDGELPYGLGNDTNTDANFIRQNPRYDVNYNSIWLYPAPTAADVSNGGKIRIEWIRQITPFTTSDYTSVLTDSTVVPGIDDPFHPILAYGPAWEYALQRNLPQAQGIAQQLQDYEARLRTHYGRKNQDRLLQLKPEYNNYR